MSLWVVQENMTSPETVERLRQACQLTGQSYQGVTVVPFSHEILVGERPVAAEEFPPGSIFYGYTTLARLVEGCPGFFYNPARFRMSEYFKHWKKWMLSHDARFCQLDLLVHHIDQHENNVEQFFVRPDGDGKEFVGTLMDLPTIVKWLESLRTVEEHTTLTTRTEVMYASPRDIGPEYRCVLVDGRCIEVSLYKHRGIPQQHRELEFFEEHRARLFTFAEEVAAVYSPHPIFVLDVGMTATGHTQGLHYQIIEAGCLNWAGWYACDYERIVRAVSEWLEKLLA